MPFALAVIMPGAGFGGNWTCFHPAFGPLALVVRANPAGMPEYMIQGGYGARIDWRECTWPEYSTFVNAIDIQDGRYVGVWRR